MKDKKLDELPEIQEFKKQESDAKNEEAKVEYKEETDLQRVLTEAIKGEDYVAKDLIKYLGVDVSGEGVKQK